MEIRTQSAVAVADNAAPRQQLSVFDSICIIVGIIVGVGLYQTAPTVAGCLPHGLGVLSLWMVGGLLSLAGALCYAELATTYPQQGGDYVYLNRAYGPWAGYLFAWADLAIIRPGSIAAMVFPFATYAQTLYSPFKGTFLEPRASVILAATAAAVLTGVNILGVRQGKWTQNLLTVAKVLGLALIFSVALTAPAAATAAAVGPKAWSMSGLNLSLILILFTYGGWNEIAYVAAEVKQPERNLMRSLVLGTAAVTALYVGINGAFLYTLGQPAMAASSAVATDAVARAFPGAARRAVSALICVSALGAANGMIFAGARIVYALGREHKAFRWLGRWRSRGGTPDRALAVQGLITVLIIIVAGSFNQVLLYTTGVVWTFFLGSGAALFVLRAKEPQAPRPYRVWGYPWIPLLFCASCLFLIYSAVTYDYKGTLMSVGVLLLGLPWYWLSGRQAKTPSDRAGEDPGATSRTSTLE